MLQYKGGNRDKTHKTYKIQQNYYTKYCTIISRWLLSGPDDVVQANCRYD